MKKNIRRMSALARLEAQLSSGTKTKKKTNKQVRLTERDIKRINREISTLNNRVY